VVVVELASKTPEPVSDEMWRCAAHEMERLSQKQVPGTRKEESKSSEWQWRLPQPLTDATAAGYAVPSDDTPSSVDCDPELFLSRRI
jgi:hypothetical protein